ncbi:MAG: leucine-rich repeat protein [Clostridia bacterium]|nr:leucine-rich repeat protein [Clostridia bacterium]
MKIINKGNGIFTVEMENERDTVVPKNLFYKNQEVEEIHFPEGVKIINDEAMPFCYCLKKVYLPSTIEQLRHGIFYGISHHTVTVYFNGSVTRFKKYQDRIKQPYL